jgi:hypothetical protein
MTIQILKDKIKNPPAEGQLNWEFPCTLDSDSDPNHIYRIPVSDYDLNLWFTEAIGRPLKDFNDTVAREDMLAHWDKFEPVLKVKLSSLAPFK